MKTKIFVLLALTAGLLTISSSVLAHHSNAPSDKDRLVTLVGTVTKFSFTNPHAGVYLDAKDAQGNVKNWYAFGASPVALHREAGWTNKTFKPGQQIVVQGHPNRDGKPLLLFVRFYQCSGEAIPVDKGKTDGDEYLTRVKIEELPPTRVQAACSGKERIPDVLGDLLKGKQ